jgi:hypothetical protein
LIYGAGVLELGGNPLIKDTTIDGGGSYQLNFQGLSSSTNQAKDLFLFETLSGGNTSLIEIDSVNVRARLSQLDDATGLTSELELTGAEFRAKTPNYTSATIGDVLTLLDNTTGAAEWQTPPTAGTLVALPFTTDHITATGNPYLIGDVVWYSGDVYICIANNDSILPTNASYWTSLGAGNPLVQQPSDWNSTSGNNQILNKPTIGDSISPLLLMGG